MPVISLYANSKISIVSKRSSRYKLPTENINNFRFDKLKSELNYGQIDTAVFSI